MRDYPRAVAAKDTAVSLVCQQLSQAALFSSEKDMDSYLKRELMKLSYTPSYLHFGCSSGRMTSIAYNDALFQKGYLQNVAKRINLITAVTPESDSLQKELKSVRYQLSREYARQKAERRNVVELEDRANKMERALARTVSGYSEAVRQVQWNEVQASLLPHEAAIEFIRFQVLLPGETDSIMYAALIVSPEKSVPEYVPLFEERDLKKVFYDSHSGVSNVYDVRGIVVPRSTVKYTNLYPLLWKPLEEKLKGVTPYTIRRREYCTGLISMLYLKKMGGGLAIAFV
jgi:hypothetical protein